MLYATEMTLHPDLQLPTADELSSMDPRDLAARLNALSGTLGERLGIEFLSLSPDEVVARMPVEGNRQPAGRLHGGASLALAEELASIGSWLNLDPERQLAVGVDLSGTHVRGVTSGYVTATAKLSYRGRRIMVWEIELKDDRGRTTSLARCTCNVINMGA